MGQKNFVGDLNLKTSGDSEVRGRSAPVGEEMCLLITAPCLPSWVNGMASREEAARVTR